MSSSILVTKLHKPQPRLRLVERRRLIDRLDRGLAEHRRLTLVSAPTGYGKTTLVSAWLDGLATAAEQAEPPWQPVWLALDEDDNDPARFFLHLVAALREVEQGIGAASLNLLSSPHPPEASALVTPLINELAALPAHIVLVIDDCHVIAARFIHAALESLCRYAPTNLHLVLLSRADPPIALGMLRARGQVTELRTEDLRFTLDEARTFFAVTVQQPLADDAVAGLEMRTEGWVAGLQLAALRVAGCDAHEVSAFVAAFSGSDLYIMDYLIDQVLQRLDPRLRSFLCQVAILDQMCAPLCDAVTGRQDSHLLLGQLDGANLFVVRLDHQGKWFRFHHLFAELLRLELDADYQAQLHRRAAAWWAAEGRMPEAIHHALSAGDFGQAAQWIRMAADDLLRQSALHTLLNWLQQLPHDLLDSDDDLMAYRVLALFFTGQVQQAAALLATFDAARLASAAPRVRGRLLALNAWTAELGGGPDVEPLALAALEHVEEDDAFFCMLALLPLGHAQRAGGQSHDSLHTFRTAARVGREAGHSFAAVGGVIDLAFDLLDQGRLRESLSLCEEELDRQVDPRGRSLPVAGLINVPLAAALYHADELERALGCAQQGLESSRRLLSEHVLGSDAQRFLALIHYRQDEVNMAFALLGTAQKGAEQVRYRRPASVLAATQIDLHLRQGNLDAAEPWILSHAFRPENPPVPACEIEYCVYARWLRLSGRYDEARQALATVGGQVRAGGRLGRLIGIRVGQALVEDACGLMEPACMYLQEAIALAAHEGYRSQFLDAGLQLPMLLRQVRHAAPAFVDDLLLRCSAQPALRADGSPTKSRPGFMAGATTESLIEPLTERELEVLNLLALGLTYREIAQRLIVAIGTIQAHCSNIYGKLGANNRTQAVLRARELGLLAEPRLNQ